MLLWYYDCICSYVSDDANLGKSINQIEIFDTMVAFLAGVMIIPAVFVFMGRDGMTASGPSLMFVSLPKVFDSMGFAGNVIGAIFFAMVFFAAPYKCMFQLWKLLFQALWMNLS